MTSPDELQGEAMEPLLTSIDVVCREIPSFTDQPRVVRHIEAFLDYSPQYWIRLACRNLSLRLVKRVFARKGWDEQDVVDGLVDASWTGKLDVIQWLCAKGEQVAGIPTSDLVKKWNRYGYPLGAAAGEGNLDIMQWLVEKGAPVNQKDYTGSTPLIESASGGKLSAVQWLLTQNADVNAIDRDGNTALLRAVAAGGSEMVACLIEAGASLHDKSNNGQTALHYAAGSSVEEVRFLVANGVELSHADKWGRTALYYASSCRNFEVVEFLLESFKEKQPPVDDTLRCFFEAVKAGRVDLLQSLITRGVDVHYCNFQGRTALHEAAASGCVSSVEFLLDRGVDSRLADKFGMTAVFEASRFGHLAALQRLVEAQGDVSVVNLSGQTPLHFAAEGGHKEVAELLLSQGAIVGKCDKRGWTPLHSAAAAGHVPLAELLVANGADIDVKTVSGQTAEALALERGHTDVELSLAKLKPNAQESSGVKDADFDEYKEYLLKRSDIQFNSIVTALQDTSEGTWLDSPIEVKVKRINGVSKNFVEELDRWAKLNHPHVVKLYGFCKSDEAGSEPYFVYERPAHASMYDYVDSVGGKLDDAWDKLYQAALGLQYLHDRNTIHGSLSPYSVAVASNGVAKLQGFDGAAEAYLPWCTAPEIVVGLPPSFESDVYVFGLVIVDTFQPGLWDLDDNSEIQDFILAGNIPEKPGKMSSSQWQVIQRMCAYDPRDRLSAADVVRELQAFTNDYLVVEKLTSEWTDTVKWSRVADVPIAHSTIAGLLAEIDDMCVGSSTTDRLSRDIYDRLKDVLHQLETRDDEPSKELVHRFGDIVRHFHMRLQSTAAVGSAQAARFAASRQGADNSFSAHRSLDAFLEDANLSRSSPIHNWREQWEVGRTQQQREMLAKLHDLPTLLEGATTDKERQDALTYLRFELSKHPASYAASGAADLTRAKSAIAPTNSSWFIPEYEVEFRQFDEFSRGAFGTVYHGKWKGSRVVVKKVELSTEDDQATFLNEVEIWHKLYHPNVVQLFGACHIGQPFFVCEYAARGQLDEYLRENPKDVWEKLCEAALGLRYLHVKGVVHGDLKCNNILIGSDGRAKLTDFGLSSLDAGREPESELENSVGAASVGAIRWKAPEVLRGEKSTYASDIYSFGMCILEATSGKYPWGTTLDAVVKFCVVKQQKLPVRPANCSEEAYDLIQQMCRFEPSGRLGMNEVVGALNGLC